MKYYEITTDANCRPEHPEDNCVIIKAHDVPDALARLKANRGKTTMQGDIVKCQVIYYVHDDFEITNDAK